MSAATSVWRNSMTPVHRAPKARTEAEWAALSEESKRVAAHRERAYLTYIFESHPWAVAAE